MSLTRHWRGEATREGATQYAAYFRESVLPALQEIDGFEGAEVLASEGDDPVKIAVNTRWRDMAAVLVFAGSDPGHAVVEDEVQKILLRFDDRVTHYTTLLEA